MLVRALAASLQQTRQFDDILAFCSQIARSIQNTRQNHAVEHATIHLLAARFPGIALAGLSDPWGFTLYGQVSWEAIEEAVREALRRLKAGEEEIALHPNCGTNLTTSISLVTAAALIGTGGRRPLLSKLTLTAALVTVALLCAGPLGMRLQRFTTSAAVGGLGLAKIVPLGRAHRITFNRSRQ